MGGEGASEGRKSPSEPLNLRVRKGGDKGGGKTGEYREGRVIRDGAARGCVSDWVLEIREYFFKENY